MRVATLLFIIFVIGCKEKPVGEGRLKIEVYDTPPPLTVEHIYLRITEVSVHSSEEGWQVIAQPDTTYDFIQLINGVTALLCDTPLKSGHYTQMRIKVADTNQIVINDTAYPLVVPSGVQTGVKLNLDFTIEEDELVEILVDFDASRSITWTSQDYKLHPSFRACKKVISGSISGTVTDTAGAPIQNAVIEAMSSTDTTSTFSCTNGGYKLILREGTYTVRASADGYTTVDTTYTGVKVAAGNHLTGYNFILW